jgi:hypothetical protein
MHAQINNHNQTSYKPYHGNQPAKKSILPHLTHGHIFQEKPLFLEAKNQHQTMLEVHQTTSKLAHAYVEKQ